jgi:hypothetical protein
LFHRADFSSSPFCRILRKVLDIVDCVVPLILDAVLGAIPALFNILWDLLDFADLISFLSASIGKAGHTQARQKSTNLFTSPPCRILREILNILLDSLLILIPVLICIVQSQ